MAGRRQDRRRGAAATRAAGDRATPRTRLRAAAGGAAGDRATPRTRLRAAAGGAIGAALLRAAYVGATRAVLRRNVTALMAGDPGPLLALYHPDVEMTFPGEHSWGRTYRGRAEVEAFLHRFLDAGLRGELGAIFVDGPPWATRIALEFVDHAHDPDSGERIYENRAVIVLRTRFGRVVREEVYEDTQKVAAFDEQLAAREAVAA